MEKVSIDNKAKLSEHFTLCEMTKTKHVTKDGNIPSRVIIENLRRLCTDWLEELRRRYNQLYGGDSDKEKPIIINSGYRSPEVNRLAGGSLILGHSLLKSLVAIETITSEMISFTFGLS